VRILLPIVPLVLVALLIELGGRAGWINTYFVPTPMQVAKVFSSPGMLLGAMWETTLGTLGGFAIAAASGVLIAIVLSSSKLLERMLGPYAILFQTVPIIAIAPLLVIWIGNDIWSVIAVAAIVSVFPIIANTLAGLRSVEPAMHDLFTLYRATPLQRLWKLKLPAALPQMLVGFRIGAGLSVIGAITGEFVTTGSGLGGVITIAKQQQRVGVVFAALVCCVVLGVVVAGVLGLVSRVALRHWHASARD
jgi:NitT/TauT family transport system permease protein